MIAALYLLKVTLCSGILLLYYGLALRNKAFHQWNRFYLLAITVLSLLLPLISIPVADAGGAKMARYISVASIDESIVVIAKQKAVISLTAAQWAFVFYLAVSAFGLFAFLKATKGILNILKRYPSQKIRQFYFLNTDAKGAPFSFLNYLVWNREIDLESKTGQHIFRHELAHIEQKHTLDKIFLIIVLIPFWANPFFWIVRKELNAIHEFIADEKALQDGTTHELSQMILNALYPKHLSLLTSPFFQSSIKRRLQMFASKNQKINYMSRIFVLPILFAVVAAFTIKQESQKGNETFLEKELPGLFSDTVPAKPNVIIEEIPKKANNIIIEEMLKDGKGNRTGNNDKIYLESDSIVIKDIQMQPGSHASVGLLIVNGKKMNKNALGDKTFISGNVTIYGKNDPEAIRLFGEEAKDGVTVLEDVQIMDKKESKLYLESVRDTVPKKEKDFEQIFTKMEVEPKFAGNWSTFLQKNLDAALPLKNGAPAGTYVVRIKFIVDKEGNLSHFEPLTKHGFGMEQGVIDLLKKSPNWQPGVQNGRKVVAYKIQNVTFLISEDKEQILAATDKLFIGIDNPIKLDFGNADPKDLIVTISQGSIHNAGSYYNARFNTVGAATIKVALKENGQIKELGSRTFAVDVIQDEKVYFKKIEQQIKQFKQ